MKSTIRGDIMEIPKTCFVIDKDPLKNVRKKFKLEAKSFIDLVMSQHKCVFSCETLTNVYYLYVVQEGFVFYTDGGRVRTFEEFKKPYEQAEESGFKDAKEFQDAQKYGINTYTDYIVFKNSNFYGVSTYKDFLEAKDAGFDKREEFLEAKKLEIPSKQDYDDFKRSGYHNYQTFLKARDGGFPDAIEYNNALQLGFSDYNQYQKYLDKEYGEFKDEIKSLLKKSHSAFKSGEYAEFLARRFELLEMSAKLLYLKIFSINLKNNYEKQFQNLISEIEDNLNEKIINIKAIIEWKKLMAKINDEGLTLEKKKADEARKFFDKSQSYLKQLFDEYERQS